MPLDPATHTAAASAFEHAVALRLDFEGCDGGHGGGDRAPRDPRAFGLEWAAVLGAGMVAAVDVLIEQVRRRAGLNPGGN